MNLEDSLNDLLKLNTEKKQHDNLVVFNKNIDKNQNYTLEQSQILNAKEKVIKIKAYAGSGKTFILQNFAIENIKKRGLYIAFNKDLKEEAEKKFPQNVKCMTMHGLAFSRFGKDLVHKLNKSFLPYHISEISEINLPKELDFIADTYYKCIYNSVINFMYSKDFKINKHHIFLEEFEILLKSLKDNQPNSENFNVLQSISLKKILSDIEIVWSHLINPDSQVGTLHDVYLKLMQLAKPQLPYETILLDEAQDVNPAMLDIFERQKVRKVLAGDPYQSIYKFRKAVDAMETSACDKEYLLSKSFRFGQEIADYANTIIALRGETNPLIGNENKLSKVGLISENEQEFLSDEYKTKAIITRTNAQIFEEALKFAKKGFDIYLEGGQNIGQFDLLEDLWHLKNNAKPTDGFLKSFFSSYKNGKEAFEALKIFSKENNMTDWMLRCNIVDKYDNNIKPMISSLKEKIIEDKNHHCIIITNVHKSKGLEYDLVMLSDDFNLSYTLNGIKTRKQKEANKIILLDKVPEREYENINLIYVAMTRAKKMLLISEELDFHCKNINKYIHNEKINESILNLISSQQLKTLDLMSNKILKS